MVDGNKKTDRGYEKNNNPFVDDAESIYLLKPVVGFF